GGARLGGLNGVGAGALAAVDRQEGDAGSVLDGRGVAQAGHGRAGHGSLARQGVAAVIDGEVGRPVAGDVDEALDGGPGRPGGGGAEAPNDDACGAAVVVGVRAAGGGRNVDRVVAGPGLEILVGVEVAGARDGEGAAAGAAIDVEAGHAAGGAARRDPRDG